VLSFSQVFFIPGAHQPQLYKVMGWLTVACVTIGATSGMKMGTEHVQILEFGGNFAVLGWIQMLLLAIVPLIFGI